ncbi:hypothetical protein [Halobacterium rubrum]|uniref:hypothetical protein n=1 Tax=Halobacterium TaxID=2239 RepID=UPI001F46A82B|nr:MULTISPECIES: hypothetical protein [Halobacterium]MDH5019739.1 hypothetical protein [Halobacterium rubrum]
MGVVVPSSVVEVPGSVLVVGDCVVVVAVVESSDWPGDPRQPAAALEAPSVATVPRRARRFIPRRFHCCR